MVFQRCERRPWVTPLTCFDSRFERAGKESPNELCNRYSGVHLRLNKALYESFRLCLLSHFLSVATKRVLFSVKAFTYFLEVYLFIFLNKSLEYYDQINEQQVYKDKNKQKIIRNKFITYSNNPVLIRSESLHKERERERKREAMELRG